MSTFGKPDATGRSSGIPPGRRGALMKPPKNEPWVWRTRETTESDAWRCRSINLARLIDFLELEHMNHAGTENGDLIATHNQLVKWGIGKRYVTAAIDEGIYLGLIRVRRGGRWAGKNDASRYRLTYYADKYGNPATNDWKPRTEDEIKVWRQKNSERKKVKAAARKNYLTPIKGGCGTP